MRRRVRLTENDLHRIIKESVKRVLRESNDNSWVQKFAERYNLSLKRAIEICEHNAEYYTGLYAAPFDAETYARMDLNGEL